jgi:hypothetical protein
MKFCYYLTVNSHSLRCTNRSVTAVLGRDALSSENMRQYVNTLCGKKCTGLGVLAKLQKATIRLVMSVCPSVPLSVFPHGTTRPPLDGFS